MGLFLSSRLCLIMLCLVCFYYVGCKFSSCVHAVTLQVVGGHLLPEAVTWFFTSVLRGLQVHGQHEVCHTTLSQLAMLIYENLVRLILYNTRLFSVFILCKK